MIVVPVLITSCHVSEKWKTGPDAAQSRVTIMPLTNALENRRGQRPTGRNRAEQILHATWSHSEF